MRKLIAAALLGTALAGCSMVSSAVPTTTNATGEAWYTKDKLFLFFFLGTDIYYCPPKTGQCKKAEIQ